MKSSIILVLKILLTVTVIVQLTIGVLNSSNQSAAITKTAVNQAKDLPSPALDIQNYSVVATNWIPISAIAIVFLFLPELINGIEKY